MWFHNWCVHAIENLVAPTVAFMEIHLSKINDSMPIYSTSNAPLTEERLEQPKISLNQCNLILRRKESEC